MIIPPHYWPRFDTALKTSRIEMKSIKQFFSFILFRHFCIQKIHRVGVLNRHNKTNSLLDSISAWRHFFSDSLLAKGGFINDGMWIDVNFDFSKFLLEYRNLQQFLTLLLLDIMTSYINNPNSRFYHCGRF